KCLMHVFQTVQAVFEGLSYAFRGSFASIWCDFSCAGGFWCVLRGLVLPGALASLAAFDACDVRWPSGWRNAHVCSGFTFATGLSGAGGFSTVPSAADE